MMRERERGRTGQETEETKEISLEETDRRNERESKDKRVNFSISPSLHSSLTKANLVN